MNITLTGSLGHIGKPLTQLLVNEGHRVTVISSRQEMQAVIEALGAAAAIGTLEDAAFLTKAFAGADAVFTMVPPNVGQLDQIGYYRRIAHNYTQAIETAGVPRAVNLSSYGAHLDKGTGLILGAHHTEIILNSLPEQISLTHLRPGYFYYNLLHFTDMIKSACIIGANYGGNDRIPLVAPADIAAAAAEELTTAATNRQVRYIVSDERRATEIAAAIGAAIGKPGLQWLTFTDEQALQDAEQNGLPAPLAALFVELGSSLHSGRLTEEYDQLKPALYGKVKLEDYVKEFAAIYKNRTTQEHHD